MEAIFTNAKQLAELVLDQVRIHAIIVVDLNGTIRGWFGGAENILGYMADEIVGQPVAQLFTLEDLERGLHKLEMEMARASSEADDDRWQLRKDGARIWCSGAMTRLLDSTGAHIGYVKVLRNRTDNKTRTEALEKQITALNEAEARKNNSIAVLAHELRGPLSSLSLAASILQEADANTLAETQAIIGRQVDLMSRMVADLMEGSRAAAGKIELHKEPVVLQEVVSSAVENCRQSIAQHRHHLEVLMPEAPVRLVADRTRLHQVFVNLIDNAVKYTPDGGSIWVKATVDGEDAIVKIHDTGEGLAPELVPHIFDLFVQANPGARAEQGLGIGLALVKDFITLHGGTVQALSDGVGKGSIFVVRLPVAEPRVSQPTPEDPNSSPPRQ